jgi:hypothetical protein
MLLLRLAGAGRAPHRRLVGGVTPTARSAFSTAVSCSRVARASASRSAAAVSATATARRSAGRLEQGVNVGRGLFRRATLYWPMRHRVSGTSPVTATNKPAK